MRRSSADRANGKALFVNGANGKPSCGSCHTLADAGTTGTVGPNLDDAFRQALLDGMTEATVRQVVRGQIAYAIDSTSTGAPGMPQNLVTGAGRGRRRRVRRNRRREGRIGRRCRTGTRARTRAQARRRARPGGNSAQVAAGKKVFAAGACGGCHTLADAGSTGNVGPNLDQLKPSKDQRRRARSTNGGGRACRSFKDQLTQQQIDAVAEYVSSVAGKS